MRSQIEKYLEGIKDVSGEAIKKAKSRVDNLVKPIGSLGELERIAIKLSGISGEIYNKCDKRCIFVFGADNGVVEEGVASAPKEVTQMMMGNFVKGVTGVSVLAKQANAELKVYDVGVDTDQTVRGVIQRRIRRSTSNILKGPAMSHDEAISSILIGIEAVKDAYEQGYNLLGVGEMGIGNTTTTTAILCAITGLDAKGITGKGAGLKEEALIRKIEVINGSVKLNNPNPKDPIDLIAKVGGFDIGAMTGAYIGAAYYQVPIVVDGYISIAAAYLATMFSSKIKDYMFLSHVSEEPGYDKYKELIGLSSPLNLNMRLGEGSGCAIMFNIIDGANYMMRDMATFEEVLNEAKDSYLEMIED